MHKKFDHTEIERKWKANWSETRLYDFDSNLPNEKEYVLVEWPYPSGNLHTGHWYAFAVPDIYVRSRRMQGKNVLFPMGFDAFGLPAENAAIKNNQNPKDWTEKNILYMRGQLDQMGNAFSWNMTAQSTDPEYFRWTQWMFTEFFKHDIAYRGKGVVNWCPGCNTVVANEQVKSDGTCERSGHMIEKREMPQWMLRITQFADALIDDLDTLPWSHALKEAQRQWIGRSYGSEIDFELFFTHDLTANDNRGPLGEKATLSVFTTRADTLFGVTYLALAPEHPWVRLATDEQHHVLRNKAEVRAYVKNSITKDEQERANADLEKTGVLVEGVVALHPITGARIPIYVADYVLGGYGSGAVMGVPAHDGRDFAFAKKYGLPIRFVVKPNETDGQSENGENEKKTAYNNKSVNREVDKNTPQLATEGILIDSGTFSGMATHEAAIAITDAVGGRMKNTYRLRDWSIGRQRYWGVPIPMVYDPEGNAHTIPLEHLPWLLPTDVDFTPKGEPPLTKSVELKERVERIFGKGWTPEYETMDTFVDSSWYFLRYIDNRNTDTFASKAKQNTLMPIDTYFGGAEHTTMHLLYSRFWQKALYALGLVVHKEPYVKRINRGLILGPDGNKMSKSKGNVIDPDEHVKRVGADTVKMYLAFIGPYGETGNYPWDMGGIAGIRRFLERVYGLREHVCDEEMEETSRLLNKTIKQVRDDIDTYKFNTAISALMIFLNHAEKHGLTNLSYSTYLKLLAPFAPFITEELWHQEGNTTSVHSATFPEADPTLLEDSQAVLVVQINGKRRGTVTVPKSASEDEVVSCVMEDGRLSERLHVKMSRVIYVPGKIINFVLPLSP